MPVVINGSTGISGTDGSASTPAVQGTDANTGLFFPAADTIAFAEGGTEVMRIDSNANVGVGTVSPQAKLVASNNGAAGLEFFVNYPGGGTGTYIQSYSRSGAVYVSTAYDAADHAFRTSGSERMRIDASGNVGIGTTVGGPRLRVSAGGVVSAPVLGNVTNYPVFISNTDIAYGLGIGTHFGTGHVWLQSQRADGTAVAYNITLNEAGGNVGIGTSSPGERLSVNGNLNLVTDGFVYSFNGGTVGQVRAGIQFDGTNQRIVFATSTNERARITAGGDFQFNSGYGSVATAFGCRAWVNFNGTGTVAIRASGNVSSITDSGVGQYIANFATAMPNINYSAVASLSHFGGVSRLTVINVDTPTTSGISLITAYGDPWAHYDAAEVYLAVFR